MPIQTSVLHLCSMKFVTCLSSGVVGMINRLRGSRYVIRIPAEIEDFSFLQNVPKVLEANPAFSLTLILPRSRTGTVWFYTSTSNKRAARPKLYTKSLTRDLKLMYSPPHTGENFH